MNIESILPNYYGLIRKLAHGYLGGRKEDVEDLVQDVMERAIRKQNNFSYGTGIGPWLKIMTRNFVFNCYRDRAKGPIFVELDQEDEAVYPVLSSWEEELSQSVFDRLQTIDPRYKDCLILHCIEGCSYKEIGEKLSIPIGTVMSRIKRAKQQYRGEPTC